MEMRNMVGPLNDDGVLCVRPLYTTLNLVARIFQSPRVCNVDGALSYSFLSLTPYNYCQSCDISLA